MLLKYQNIIVKQRFDSARQDRQGDLKSERSSRKSSRKSSRTSKSSQGVESQMALEKARQAELQVEAQYMQKRQIFEQESKTLNLHYEMAKAEAKIKAYETFEENSQHSIKKFSEPADKSQFVRDYVNLHKIEYNPSDVKSQTIRRDTEQNERKLQVILNEGEASAVSKSNVRKQQNDLNQVLRYLQAPEVDIDIFSGKSIDYQYFISTFVEVVETKIEEPKRQIDEIVEIP